MKRSMTTSFKSLLLGVVVLWACAPHLASSRIAYRYRFLEDEMSMSYSSDTVDPCEDVDVEVLETVVLLDFTGNQNKPIRHERHALERAFLDVYNDISEETCPSGLRKLESVNIECEDIDPGLGGHQRKLGKNKKAKAYAKGHCATSGSGGRGFSDRRRRKLTSPLTENRNDYGRGQMNREEREMLLLATMDEQRRALDESIPSDSSDEVCLCPGPTTSSFTHAYDDLIQDLRDEGVLTNIDSVESTTELEEVDCPEEINEFVSDVMVVHSGRPETVTFSELNTIGEAFVDAYTSLNALNDETCDPHHRVVEEVFVEIEPDDSGVSMGEGRTFAWLYHIRGRFRGDNIDMNLFDEGKRRSLLQSGARRLGEGDRILTDPTPSGTCYCPPGADKRAPTTEEFETVFDEAIKFLVETGVIEDVESVESVTEVDSRG